MAAAFTLPSSSIVTVICVDARYGTGDDIFGRFNDVAGHLRDAFERINIPRFQPEPEWSWLLSFDGGFDARGLAHRYIPASLDVCATEPEPATEPVTVEVRMRARARACVRERSSRLRRDASRATLRA